MKGYSIATIPIEEVIPFGLAYAIKYHIPFSYKWVDEWAKYCLWFGAQCAGRTWGALGIMTCESMPDDLCVTCLYGKPQATKIMLDHVLSFPHKHKFGYVANFNKPFQDVLKKRGWRISPETEVSPIGLNLHLVEYIGGGYGN
jgi:hypothetical protein